jgi:hypothetical protein
MALVMGGFSQNGGSPRGTFSSTKLGDSKTIPSFYKNASSVERRAVSLPFRQAAS